jgi:hypothetical protein
MEERLCPTCREVKPISEFYKDKRKKGGVRSSCKKCGNTATAKYRKTSRESRKMQDLCVKCGKNPARKNRVTCEICAPILSECENKMRSKRLKTGFCVICGNTPFMESDRQNTYKTCDYCFLKGIARTSLGNAAFADDLKRKLEEQNYRCVYTGRLLKLGENASIDHIFPRSKFPKLAKNIDNIQWVDIVVNRMKRDLTEEDFLNLIETIYKHQILEAA